MINAEQIVLTCMVWFPVAVVRETGAKLRYSKPPKVWTEALPLVNGRLVAMAFSGVEEGSNKFDQDDNGGKKASS